MTRIAKTSHQLLDWASFRDLAAVVAVLVIVKQSLLPFTLLYAGPASTLSAMILATVLLKRRGLGWNDERRMGPAEARSAEHCRGKQLQELD